jgi:archaellum component FlaC
MESIERVIIPTVEELQMTLKSVRKITDDVGVVTEEVKGLSGSIREIRENVKCVSEAVSAITKNSVVQVSGVKAGVKAGFEYFIKNLLAKGQQDH